MKTKLSYGENIKDEEYVIVNIIIRIYCIFFKKRTQLIFFPKNMLRWRKAELPLHGWKIVNPRKNIRKKESYISVSYGNTALLYIKFVILGQYRTLFSNTK